MFKLVFAAFLFAASTWQCDAAARRRHSDRDVVTSDASAESTMQGFVQASQMVAALVKAYGLGVRLDVMAYAVGFHFIIDKVGDGEKKDRHVVAKTVMKMWHQLNAVEAVDDIFLNVTIALVRGNIDSKNFLNETLLYRFLELEFGQNAETRGEYAQLKSKIARLPLVVTNGEERVDTMKINFSAVEGLERILEFAFAKRCMLNWYFVVSSRPHEITKANDTYRERYILARSMLWLAKHTRLNDELQRIYDRSLNEASRVVKNIWTDFEKGCGYLFETIDEKIKADDEIREKVREISSTIRAEEIFSYLPDSEFTLLPPMR